MTSSLVMRMQPEGHAYADTNTGTLGAYWLTRRFVIARLREMLTVGKLRPCRRHLTEGQTCCLVLTLCCPASALSGDLPAFVDR